MNQTIFGAKQFTLLLRIIDGAKFVRKFVVELQSHALPQD